MFLASSDSNTLKFDFDKNCGINPAKESHMLALTLRFDDADTITSSCTAFIANFVATFIDTSPEP